MHEGLGAEDPVTKRLGYLAVNLDRLLQDVEAEQAGGPPVRATEV